MYGSSADPRDSVRQEIPGTQRPGQTGEPPAFTLALIDQLDKLCRLTLPLFLSVSSPCQATIGRVSLSTLSLVALNATPHLAWRLG